MAAVIEQRAYKSFLVQRSILDSFRLYLDMSEAFIDRLETEKLLTKDELIIIRGLNFPSNRNEFMKVLVKKSWNQEQFATFSTVLKDTQHYKLSDEIIGRAKDFVAEVKAQDTSQLAHDPVKSSVLTGPLATIPLSAKNQVLGLLRDKDEVIHTLRRDKERLQMRVTSLVADGDSTRRQLATLDRAVTTTLHDVGVETEKGHATFEDAMAELRDRFKRQTSINHRLHHELREQAEEKTGVKEKLSMLIEENISLKKSNQEWSQRYKELKASTEKEIAALRTRVSNQNSLLEELRQSNRQMESMHFSSTQVYEQEITNLNARLQACDGQRQQAILTRDRAITELLHMKEETRKLMKTLQIENGKGIKGAPIEHARSIVHVRKRQMSKQVKPQRDVQHKQTYKLSKLHSIPEEDKVNASNKNPIQTKKMQKTTTHFPNIDNFAPISVPPSSANDAEARRVEISPFGERGAGVGSRGGTPVKQNVITPTLDINNSKRQTGMTGRRIIPNTNQAARPKTREDSFTTTQTLPKPKVACDQDYIETEVYPQSRKEPVPMKEDYVGGNSQNQGIMNQSSEVQCITCLQFYVTQTTNTEDVCLFHDPGAKRVQAGSAVEVWSCCGQPVGHKGCSTGPHIPLQ